MKKDYFVHSSSYVSKDAQIGRNTKIWHFCHIMPGTKIGKNCRFGQNVYIGPNVQIGNNVKVQNNVSIYQGVTLGDDVFCGPSCVFTNVLNPRSAIPRMDEVRTTWVEKGATIGANATIVCGHRLGRYAFIGAGSVVTKDLPDYALAYGSPARIRAWICECGEKLKFIHAQATCKACNKQYRRTKGVKILPRVR